jgi:hypothetical protein
MNANNTPRKKYLTRAKEWRENQATDLNDRQTHVAIKLRDAVVMKATAEVIVQLRRIYSPVERL